MFRLQQSSGMLSFNPRSPWEERPGMSWIMLRFFAFQSTLPVGGATLRDDRYDPRIMVSIHAPRGRSDTSSSRATCFRLRFNPRSPWEERLAKPVASVASGAVSIHAPRGRSDPPATPLGGAPQTFQSTLPVGGATCDGEALYLAASVSIHAPRGRSDDNQDAHKAHPSKVSIHAPRGRSDAGTALRILAIHGFQSTLPVGGATTSN